jgi:tRNA pseudouridine65 synthase
MSNFAILYQDQDLVVIDKPSGFHVHRPENNAEKVPRHKIILHQLRDQLGQKVYPLHRLDVGTSGVLAFALNSEAASFWGLQFQSQSVEKTYWTVVRGFLPDQGEINEPLESDSSGEMVPCQTLFKTMARLELNAQVGKKHPSARYSFLEVFPKTGRFHQIRRHMNRISHPVLGDASHGDSRHNRFFREQLQISGLCLRAVKLQLGVLSLEKETPLTIAAPLPIKWKKIADLFKVSLP